MSNNDRLEFMLKCFGEACSLTQASKILGRCWATVRTMCEDGRLRYACGGSRVDVRSIEEYLEAPKQKNWEAKVEKIKMKHNSSWAI